jgi:transposase InsO family protein
VKKRFSEQQINGVLGEAEAVDPLHRAAGRSRHRAIGRQRRRLLRQRAGRNDQPAVQGRVVHRHSWRNREELELETLRWVDWFNHRRLLGSIGHIPPAEAEANYHQHQRESAIEE